MPGKSDDYLNSKGSATGDIHEEIHLHTLGEEALRSRSHTMKSDHYSTYEDVLPFKETMGDTGLDSHQLQRGLKARHLVMISLGGTIGTGLFLASGASVAEAGPGGALLAYGLIGIMIFFMMESLGEMSTYIPIAGSFNNYAGRFIDPALGFALGWNYWYSWAVTVAVELTASSMVMAYWLPNIPSIVWSVVYLVPLLLLNLLSVKGYGEAEYWFAMVKVLTVIIFIILGILVDTGVLGGIYYGVDTFNRGGIQGLGTFSAFLTAGFSFQGTELVGVAAGESENPRKNVPKAIRQVYWRIILFYLLSLLMIGLIIPYDDPLLLKSDISNVSVSPFTLVFMKAGIQPAAHIMNAVILTTVLSAGNSGLYASSRTLYDLSNERKAPKFLQKMTSRGVPIYCVLITGGIGMLAFLTSLFGNGVVYAWLLNISSVTGFIAWMGICASHYRFRKAYVAQGYDVNDLPYKAKLFPVGPIFAFLVCAFVVVGQGYSAWSLDPINPSDVIAAYIGIPIVLVFYLGYKIVKKTKVIPLLEADLISGRHSLM
ncbi:amino acid permease/ SLC12A domain-containing protein [Pilobolus umbonatus]|nr:amino acid permease/ SLC12A domain-containing protein [Pilobolus umbonatus]